MESAKLAPMGLFQKLVIRMLHGTPCPYSAKYEQIQSRVFVNIGSIYIVKVSNHRFSDMGNELDT